MDKKDTEAHYQVVPYRELSGQPVSWASRVFNEAIVQRREKLALTYRKNAEEDARRDGLGYVSCEKANGKIIGDYLIEKGSLPADTAIAIVYPPDSALPMAEGMALSLRQNNIRHEIYPAHGEQFTKDIRDWRKNSYAVPTEAIQMAQQSGVLLLCEGTIHRGSTLIACLRSIPDDYTGKVVIAASQELVGNSHFVANDYINPSPLIEEIKQINSGKSSKKFSVELCVTNRLSPMQDQSYPDMGDTIQAVYQEGRKGLSSMGERLTKRKVDSAPDKPRTL